MTTNFTRDIPDHFLRHFLDACAEIGCNPLHLLGVMFSESNARADAINEGPAGESNPDKRYNAVGLIQFMPPILAGLGFRRDLSPSNRAHAFRHLDATGQLPFVVAYFNQWAKTGKPWSSAARLYQATFVPATLAMFPAEDMGAVLVARGGFLGWAYSANAVFDANGDGKITIAELDAAIRRNAKGARWRELLERLGLEEPPHTLEDVDGDGLPEVTSIADVQEALSRLGYDPGDVDGIDGPKTRAAVRAFQTDHEGLAVDGIPGRHTRRALAEAVSTAA